MGGSLPPFVTLVKDSMELVDNTALKFHCSHDVAKTITQYIDKSELIGESDNHSSASVLGH